MTVLEFDTLEALSAHGAAMVGSIAREAVAQRGAFTLSLAGGSTPKRTYELLTEADMPWDKSHLFWGDERFVDKDDPDSNYRMVKQILLDHIDIPATQVHPIRVGGMAIGLDAGGYELALRSAFTFNKLIEAGGLYAFDCILLGMGEDGHTASLFPGSEALLAKRTQLIQAVETEEGSPAVKRITMTAPLINMARNVIFMVQGKAKRSVMDEIQKDRESAASKYPAAMINPRGNLTWLVAE